MTMTELNTRAAVSDAYAAAMRRTSVETGGRLGADHSPLMYAAHIGAAERARRAAFDLTLAGMGVG